MTALVVRPSQSEIQTILRSYLMSFLPADFEVVAGQDNRVPEPIGAFVSMTVLRRTRLATNIDDFVDCAFLASIADTTMTVSSVLLGTLEVGREVFGEGVAPATRIVALGTGTGGVGTYTVSVSQSLTERKMAAGHESLTQPTEVVLQLDVHSPSDGAASDAAQAISTMLRDERGVRFFAAAGADVEPLYTSDPRQMPFVNAEQQYETRYMIEAALQANQTVQPGQEFADALVATLINVDAAFPAT